MYSNLDEKRLTETLAYLQEVVDKGIPINPLNHITLSTVGPRRIRCISLGYCTDACPLYHCDKLNNHYCKLSTYALRGLNTAEQVLLALELIEVLKEALKHDSQ